MLTAIVKRASPPLRRVFGSVKLVPQKNADDIERPHNLYTAFRSGRRKRKQLGDFGNHRVQNQIEHRQPTAGHQHEQTCITMRLFFVPGPQTAPHYRGHCNADGRARQVEILLTVFATALAAMAAVPSVETRLLTQSLPI